MSNSETIEVLRETNSICPSCFKSIPGKVVVAKGVVYLRKVCPVHGEISVLLSRHPDYWKELSIFYFSLMKKIHTQRDYIVRLTDRCNMDCSICLASANKRPLPDFPLDALKQFLKKRKRHKVDLMGAEPTVRDDLPELIQAVEESGNIAALHTNGLKLTDPDYVYKLKKAGVREVHLQYDGYDDASYKRIRGMPLVAVKERVIQNLRRYHIATDLVVTILRNVNERYMRQILEFSARKENGFIKEVFYLGCRFLGGATASSYDSCLMPDEVMDLFIEQMEGMISRDDIMRFQKLYFAFLHFFGVRKCFYIHHYVVIRDGSGGFIPIHKILNLKKIEQVLERYRRLADRHPILSRCYLPLALAPHLLKRRSLGILKESVILNLLLFLGFDLSKLPSSTILLGFISACDPMILDHQIAAHCGKGELSLDLGTQQSGAWANVMREKLMSEFAAQENA